MQRQEVQREEERSASGGRRQQLPRQQQSILQPIQLHAPRSPVPAALQVFPSRQGGPPGIPSTDSAQTASAGPETSQLKVQAQAVSALPRLYIGGFKRLLRVSEGGTHAGWRAGEPLILDQSQCPSLIRPWRGNEK